MGQTPLSPATSRLIGTAAWKRLIALDKPLLAEFLPPKRVKRNKALALQTPGITDNHDWPSDEEDSDEADLDLERDVYDVPALSHDSQTSCRPHAVDLAQTAASTGIRALTMDWRPRSDPRQTAHLVAPRRSFRSGSFMASASDLAAGDDPPAA